MLHENLKIMDWGADMWNNLYHSIFHKGTPKSTILILHRDNIPLKVIHTTDGIRPDLKQVFSQLMAGSGNVKDAVRAIYNAENVDTVCAISQPAIRTIFRDFQLALDMDDSYIKQLFTLKDAMAKEFGHGIIQYPYTLQRLKDIEYDVIKKVFGFIPNNTLFMLTVFEENDIWTNWVIGVQDGSVSMITTIDAILPESTVLKSWRKEHHILTKAVHKKFGTKPISFFMDKSTFSGFIHSRNKFDYILEATSAKRIIAKMIPIKYRVFIFIRMLLHRVGKLFHRGGA